MTKKRKMEIIIIALSVVLVIGVIAGISVIAVNHNKKHGWKTNPKFDLSLPVLGENGWYLVFEDDFNGNSLNENIIFGERYTGNREIWTTSPHAIRWKSDDEARPEQGCWWCPEMVEVKNSCAVVHSRYEENHSCSGDCPKKGRFTGGIETRIIRGDNSENKGTADEMLFSQAFGYFECSVKFPDSDGLWSAFWLQSPNQRIVGNDGEDGTEIDVYESAFRKSKTPKMGHALLWDGYGAHGRVDDYIGEVDADLYDGFHTFALKWTPDYYVFYIDGKPTWATDGGGVSKVREFLRLTVEIDAGDNVGPHGQKMGVFSGENTDFLIEYVKVWQNESYEQYIKDDSYYTGNYDPAN